MAASLTRQQESKLGRQRGGQIMGLFYRMLALYLYTERFRMRMVQDPEERARIRKVSWTRLGATYREHASNMGGLLIKVGQLLSARGDIFPTEFTTALSGLQDTVPGVTHEAIREVVEAEFGRPIHQVYATFDTEPLAAASLGQVRKATLVDGRTGAVKVMSCHILLRELDLRDEANHTRRFGAMFADYPSTHRPRGHC
jgi:predicted unusual protein kinase regulating ubiquinone biosynthesis (AarF/ABC1/UbiB family)